MTKPIYIKVERGEGYEDVCDELVLEDFLISPKAWEATLFDPGAAPDLLEVLEAALDAGIIPKSSASEGGANKFSQAVRIADRARAAIAKARGTE